MQDPKCPYKYVNTTEWNSWRGMHRHCKQLTHHKYLDYGGRGITVCEHWEYFENFLHDMGMKPSPKHSIDRINNDGNYCPENCRWALPYDQLTNQRPRKTVLNEMEVRIFKRCRELGMSLRSLVSVFRVSKTTLHRATYL